MADITIKEFNDEQDVEEWNIYRRNNNNEVYSKDGIEYP